MVLVFSGGLVDLGDIKSKNVAIVQGWFPGATGGTAIAETVMGEQNRFGKLPFTYLLTQCHIRMCTCPMHIYNVYIY